MNPWNSTDEILDFAIGSEEQAAEFYKDMAAKMDAHAMAKVFTDFAREEEGHKAKLIAVKQGGRMQLPPRKIQDLRIGDYTEEVDPEDGELDYQKALILAMKREKKAFLLYTRLAEATDAVDLRVLLAGLAQEEAKHKLRFEIEYDDYVLKEN